MNPRLRRSPIPTGFAEVVSDGFPILHAPRVLRIIVCRRRTSRLLWRSVCSNGNFCMHSTGHFLCTCCIDESSSRVGSIGCCCFRHVREGASEYYSSDDCNSFHGLGIMSPLRFRTQLHLQSPAARECLGWPIDAQLPGLRAISAAGASGRELA